VPTLAGGSAWSVAAAWLDGAGSAPSFTQVLTVLKRHLTASTPALQMMKWVSWRMGAICMGDKGHEKQGSQQEGS
jgi:hypothetical protein